MSRDASSGINPEIDVALDAVRLDEIARLAALAASYWSVSTVSTGAVSTEEQTVMTHDEFRTLVLARCGDVITGDDFDMLSAAPGEEMIPASIFAEVLEVIEIARSASGRARRRRSGR
jgi:hypothetical protein